MNKINNSGKNVTIELDEKELEDIINAMSAASAAKKKESDKLFIKGNVSLANANEKEAEHIDVLKRKLMSFIGLPF